MGTPVAGLHPAAGSSSSGSTGVYAVEDVTGTTYTVVSGDAGKAKRFTNAAAVTVTLPAGVAVGTTVELLAWGAGGLVVQDDGTSTVELEGIVNQYESASAVVVATNTWSVVLSAADVSTELADHVADPNAHKLQANNQTGTTYTLVLSDAGKVIEANNASAITLTVPQNSSVAFAVGTVIEVFQQGAGQVTVSGTGVTFRARSGQKTAGQYAVLSLWKRATDEWVVTGDTST